MNKWTVVQVNGIWVGWLHIGARGEQGGERAKMRNLSRHRGAGECLGQSCRSLLKGNYRRIVLPPSQGTTSNFFSFIFKKSLLLIHFINLLVCIYYSHTPNLSSSPSLLTRNLFSMSVSLFLFYI